MCLGLRMIGSQRTIMYILTFVRGKDRSAMKQWMQHFYLSGSLKLFYHYYYIVHDERRSFTHRSVFYIIVFFPSPPSPVTWQEISLFFTPIFFLISSTHFPSPFLALFPTSEKNLSYLHDDLRTFKLIPLITKGRYSKLRNTHTFL